MVSLRLNILCFATLSVLSIQMVVANTLVDRGFPRAVGQTCKCKAVPNDRRCFRLLDPSLNVSLITTGRNGLKCAKKDCGVRYECCETGAFKCLVKSVPYTLTCTGLYRGQEVCQLTRPDSKYLVLYSDIPMRI
jgi:hypothetical protein